MLTVKTSILALLMALSALGGGYAVWQVQGFWYQRKEAKRAADQLELDRLNRAAANVAATTFETKKAKNEVRYKTITREVEKLVDRPVYQSACFDDDGLRLLNDHIARRDASKPQPAVP